MKKYLEFEHLKRYCLKIAEDAGKGFRPDEVIAVCRGGLVPAAIVAKKLKLPVGVFYPATKQLILSNPLSKRLLFVEDLIAEGRTYKIVKKVMTKEYNKCFKWEFAPVLVDASAKHVPKYYGFTAKEWIVMPWEDESDAVENDRGLFRDGSDKYGK